MEIPFLGEKETETTAACGCSMNEQLHIANNCSNNRAVLEPNGSISASLQLDAST